MAILGSAFSDIASAIKDMIIFFVAYTLLVFVIGQWFTVYVPMKSDLWWYPMYLLIIVLVIKVIADLFTSKPREKGKK